MSKIPLPTVLILVLISSIVIAQTPPTQSTKAEVNDQDVIRISTSLVETDVVVTDKNDQVIPDLTINDFKVFDNGKRQEVKFMEFVGVDTPSRSEGTVNVAGQPIEPEVARNLSTKDLRRVFGFVVDDLT